MDTNITPLAPSLLALALKLDQKEIIPLARVFGSAPTSPDAARDLDLAFFCPYHYSTPAGQEFANAVSSQVLGCGSRRSGHYGELDVFIFFPDFSLVRNDECSGWSKAKAATKIKKAASAGQPWIDFVRAHVPNWDRASCPPPRLRQWVCSDSPYPLDEQTIASMARAVADLSPWLSKDGFPRNVLTEAIEKGHLDIIQPLIAAGAPLMPELPDDPEKKMELSGQAYYPSVAALVAASYEIESQGLEYMLEQTAELVDISTRLIKAGADPLAFDLAGNPLNTLDALMELAKDIQEQSRGCDVSGSPLPAAMGALMDAILDSCPEHISDRVRREVCSFEIETPRHELNKLARAPSVMGLWLASIRQSDLEGRVEQAAVSEVKPSPRM